MPEASIPKALEDRTLIDTVVVLASLTSDPKVIDPMLDIVRQVTAGMQPGRPLTSDETSRLEEVRLKLTDHLIHDDKMRSFTKESLDQLVSEKVGSGSGAPSPHRRRNLYYVRVVFAAMVCAYGLGAVLLSVLQTPSPFLFASMFSFGTMYVGMVWLFLSILPTFTQNTRL